MEDIDSLRLIQDWQGKQLSDECVDLTAENQRVGLIPQGDKLLYDLLLQAVHFQQALQG